VSICPQFDNHLFPALTPRQHFKLYGRLKGYSDEELQRQIDDYEGLMNLGQFAERRVSQLSGGNARKLSIALAFLGSAPIIFLDEPTASLDPVARLQTQALIEEKAGGRTILLCTHLLSEAEKLCDRMCIMLKGKVHAVGTHRHLSEKFGTKWKVEIGLVSDDDECREKVNRFMAEHFPGAELAGTRFAAATYNVPSADMQLPEVFVILSEHRSAENGYTYFTCSMSTLERVFIDLVMQAEA
jgi:ABC-type multidrug transport system ATPase subunit